MRLVWQVIAVLAVSFLGSQGLALAGDNPWLPLVVGLATGAVDPMSRCPSDPHG